MTTAAQHDTLHCKMSSHSKLPGPDASRNSQFLKGLAELATLSLLQEAPQYGLGILDALRDRCGLAVAEGSIYPMLHRLERNGLIASEWQIDATGGRPRRYYLLTAQGQVDLSTTLAEWSKVSASLNLFLNRSLSK